MRPPAASDTQTFDLLSSNLQGLNDKIKILKFNELHEELKLLQYERDALKEQLDMALLTQKKLTTTVANLRANEQLSLQRIDQLTGELRKADKAARDALANTSADLQRLTRLEQELAKTKESLEFTNRKCKASARLLTDFFADDPTIQTILREQIARPVEIMEQREPNCDNEIGITSIYTEELVKILVVLKNDYQRKEAPPARDPTVESLVASDVFQKEQFPAKQSLVKSRGPNGREDLLSKRDIQLKDVLRGSKIENKDIIDAMASDTIMPITENVREIWENIQLIRDKMEATTKVEETEKFLELKNKNNRLKAMMAEVETQTQGLREQLDLKDREISERNYLLVDAWKTVRQLAGKETNEEKFREELEGFDRFKFELRLKSEVDDLQKKMASLTVPVAAQATPTLGQGQVSKRDNDGKGILNERDIKLKNDFIAKLQAEKIAYESTVQAYHIKVRQLNRKISQLEAAASKGQPQVAPTKPDVLLSQMMAAMRSEVEAKEEINRRLGKQLQEMTEKVIAVTSEKETLARQRVAADEAFQSLNQKAAAVRIIAEKAAKVYQDNVKLRSSYEAFVEKMQQILKKSQTFVGEGAKDYSNIVDELAEALQNAHDKPNLDPADFKRIFFRVGAQRSAENKPRSSNVDPAAVEGLAKTDSGADGQPPQDKKQLLEVNKNGVTARVGDKVTTFANDQELVVFLNNVLVENSELKGKLDVREKRIISLNKDLLHFKRKTKEIGEVDLKIESLVVQNAKLKSFVMELHSVIMEKTASNAMKVADLTDQLNASGQLLQGVIENTKRVSGIKKGLEKRNFILQDQLDAANVILETKKTELGREIESLKAQLDAKERELEPLRTIKQTCVRQELELKKKEDEIDKLLRLNEMKNMTIDVLEKNLALISETGSHDKQRVVQQLETMRQQLMEQINERTKLVSEILALKIEVTRHKEVAQEKEDLRLAAEESLRHSNERIERLTSEVRDLTLQVKALTMGLERVTVESDSLRIEKRSLEAELVITRSKLEEYVNKMRDLVAVEREKITEEIANQNKERFARLEQKYLEQQRALSEATFGVEKYQREIEELQGKLEAKNKQLFQFNQYFGVIEGTKNIEKVEFTQLLIQNKNLLKEVERLRGKVRRLTEAHESLLETVETRIGTPAEEEVAFEMDLLAAKNGLLVTKFEDHQRAKITNAIRLYEDRIAQQEAVLRSLQNKLAVAENEAKSGVNQLQAAKTQIADMKSKMALLKEENRALLTHKERQRLIEEEIRTRNTNLANQNAFLNERALQIQNSMLLASQVPRDMDKSDLI